MKERDRIELAKRMEQFKRRHVAVLNRLEPHLGCVVCGGALIDGRCPACQEAP